MKEYLLMLFVFMGAIFLFGWFFGTLLISWIIVGRAALKKEGVHLGSDGLSSYWFYLAWPVYMAKLRNT